MQFKDLRLNKNDPFEDAQLSSEMVVDDLAALSPTPISEPIKADSVGALLCAARMRLGGDLEEISRILRIRYSYMVAIEDGRHEDLPGPTYSSGFVRAYAEYLGLSGSEIVRRLHEESSVVAKTPRYKFPHPIGDSGLPNGVLLAIAAGLGMLVYGTWYTMSSGEDTPVDLIQEVPLRLSLLLDDPSLNQEAVGESTTEKGQANKVGGEFIDIINPTKDGSTSDVDSKLESVVVKPVTDNEEQLITSDEETINVVPNILEIDSQVDLSFKNPVPSKPNQSPVVALDNKNIDAVFNTESERVLSLQSQVSESESEGPSLFKQSSVGDPLKEQQVSIDEDLDENEIEYASIDAEIAIGLGSANDGLTSDEVADKVVLGGVEAKLEKVEELAFDAETSSYQGPGSSVGNESEVGLAIELRAKSDSWIQVRSGDELLLTKLLKQGEVYRVPEERGLTLMTGNAGGLEVFVNDQLMPPLGDLGVVRRNIELCEECLRPEIESR